MIDCRLDEKRIIGELHMAETPVIEDPEAAIKEALAHPIDSKPFKELFKAGETVAIIANDTTRIANTHVFMPIILDELNEVGIPDENIKIVFALGTHRDMTEAEMISEVGMEQPVVWLCTTPALRKRKISFMLVRRLLVPTFGSIVM